MNKHNWRIMFGVGVAYAITIGLMALPNSIYPSQSILGNSFDTWIFYWNNWWLEKAIVEGRNWFFTSHLFYPQGASLVAHSHSFLNSLLALLLNRLVGPVAVYNLVLLFGLWISAVGMFLLIYEMTRRVYAGLLAGFIFAFTPYHLTQALVHPHLGSIHWWPFYALFLRRALRGLRAVDALYASFFAALTLWSGLHLALLLALWTVVYIGYFFLETSLHTERDISYLHAIGIVMFIGTVTLMLTAPITFPVAKKWNQMIDLAAAFDEGANKYTDLLSYLLPPTYNLVVGPHVHPLYERIDGTKYVPYLGYTVLGLALASLLSLRKEPWFWSLSTGFWMALSVGTILHLNGAPYPHIPTPYRFIGHLFPLSALRAPERFNLLVVFSLSVSAGLGVARLARHQRWFSVPLLLLILIEYLYFPLPSWGIPPTSPFFQQMSQDQEMYGVVDYPMGYDFSKKWLYYQTIHGKPIVEGHISRYASENYVFITSNSLLRAFYQVADKPNYISMAEFNESVVPVEALGPALRALKTSGVRYILLHKHYLNTDLEAHFRRLFPFVPFYEDSTLAVYEVARPLRVCYDGFPVSLTPNIALARFDVQHDEVGQDWQLQVLVVPLASRISPLPCQIQLIGENGSVLERPVTFFGALPEEEGNWVIGDLAMQEAVISLPSTLAPGTYRWAMACPELTTYNAPETLKKHLNGNITYLRRSVNLHYGDIIQLLGYRWRTEGTDLQMTLMWKALKKPDTDYKVFVHLLNTEGKIVRQYDAIPCNWQCPTSQWHAGDIISDRAIISLQNLPPGKYRVAIGLYSLTTQKRLPVRGSEGESYSDGYFIIPDTFRISVDYFQTKARP